MISFSCRSCGAALSTVFADLGLTPISNALVRPEDAASGEMIYPLKAYVCEACKLVQLPDVTGRDAHFHGKYVYFSSVSQSWLAHAERYVATAIERFGLNNASQVVEVASNDGYLLRFFKDRSISCLGIDPAENCARAALQDHGVETQVAFFGSETAMKVRVERGSADLIVANNVLAHVPDLNDFIAGFRILLKPDGVATFEFPHLLRLMEDIQFDTLYHEHYSYLSLLAVRPLFERHGLQIVDVEQLETHGGSLRLFVRHAGVETPAPSVATLEAQEQAAELNTLAPYQAFDSRVQSLRRSLLHLLIGLKNGGRRIVGYGAPAKGNTLLNVCGIKSDMLDFTVDRSVHKQGLLLPGVRIPVLAPEAVERARPDFVMILPWNLETEIRSQLRFISAWGGRFIIPIPAPRIVAA